VLKHLNLTIQPGEHMAVVGLNGSGKTTMIKLLCRLYDPTEGRILLNGVDIRSYSLSEYRKLFSVIFQDFKLFPLSIGANIATAEEYNKGKVLDQFAKIGFKERYQKMEQKLDTVLYKDFDENGIHLSGGEEQKLTFARALYKEAPIVILDEPTAALDPIAEYDIYTTFDQTIGNRTAIFISHRLSSCRFCHNISVFEDVEIVQQGTHEELVDCMLKCGSHRRSIMWRDENQLCIGAYSYSISCFISFFNSLIIISSSRVLSRIIPDSTFF